MRQMARWRKLLQRGDAPCARSSHVITALDSERIILYGGEQTPRVPVCNQIYRYELRTCTWKIIRPVPGPAPCKRIAPAAAAMGSTLFIFGGRTGIDMGEGALNDLWAMQFGLMTTGENAVWSEIEVSGPAPPARSYHRMVSVGARLYVFGGCGQEGRLADLWELDTAVAAPAWRQLPTSDAIRPRGGAGLVALNDSLYVFGGFCGHEVSDVHRFDLASETWEVVVPDESTADGGPPRAGLPPRSVFAAAPHGRNILLFGGEVAPVADGGHAKAGSFSADSFSFDPEAKAWTQLQPEGEGPPARGWTAACALPEGLLVHGGNNLDNSRANDLYLLEVAEGLDGTMVNGS